MDELLSFMEEDFGGDDDQGEWVGEGPSSGNSENSVSTGSKPPTEENKKDLTFKDIFGSPDKRDVKEFGLSSASKSKLSEKITNRENQGSLNQLQLSSAISRDTKVPYKPANESFIVDPFSRVRVIKTTISIYFDETVSAEAVLKERNIGLEFVSLPSFSAWCRGKGKDAKNFWISACLTKKTAGVRKSAKGNDYSIWELNDLKDLDRKVTVFLFGAASSATNLSATPVGALVDITSPSVMPDTTGNSGAIKLSVNNASQIRFIGTAKDFGHCQARKKDGNKCTAIVNLWECSFCIHHASSELKKLNIGLGKKGKSNPKNSFFPNKPFAGGESQDSLKQQGIVIADFGGPSTSSKRLSNLNQSYSGGGQGSKAKSQIVMPPSSRMELQGPSSEMKKNSVRFGNPDSVKFVTKEKGHELLKIEKPVMPARKPLDLNPTKTRHLTDKDRALLQMLDAKASSPGPSTKPTSEHETKKSSQNRSEKKSETGRGVVVSELITSSIVNNPNAAGRNFMQFLTLQHAPKDQVDLTSNKKSTELKPLVMTREKIQCMAKALDFVKKNGPIKKADPNSVTGKKRKVQQLSPGGESSKSVQEPKGKKRTGSSDATQIEVEFDFSSEEFKKILNAKSAHDDELDEIQHEEYFNKLEKKEALENKLLNTYTIETNAVMCRQCKYVALGQSEFCKEQMHEVRLVKARKRFFKCKDCGNRTMSLDRLPKRPCSNCNNSNWLVAPVGRERKGPTLPSEMLAIRGNEEKFVGSAGAKMFLHLEM